MVNYKNGKIYKLSNKINDKFYIGSTTTTLSKRKSKYPSDVEKCQKNGLYKEIDDLGWKDDNGRQIWTIELIETFPCDSKTELEVREGFYQRKFLSECPELVLNQRLEGDPKDSRKRAAKKYKENNPEKVKHQQETYREENKKELNAKKREKCICNICGAEVSKNALKEHKSSQYCQHKALEMGLVKEEDIVVLEKKVPDHKKEYDRQRYLQKKEDGEYEAGKTGPREYQSCDFVLQRKNKDGKKAGDKCGKNCILKAGETIPYCSMHIRVLAKKNNK
tara:strand:+ start:128 stop:961 length:834 start_codon:yes stop_codon:yes gene_type:complete